MQVTAVPCTDDSSTAGNMWKLWRASYIIFSVLLLVVFHWTIIGVMHSELLVGRNAVLTYCPN